MHNEAMDSALVSRAIVVWTGFGETHQPARSEQRLVEAFGRDLAAELLPDLSALEVDFYASDASNTVAGMAAMANRAADDFRKRHPDIDDVAVAALAWCYAFDWK